MKSARDFVEALKTSKPESINIFRQTTSITTQCDGIDKLLPDPEHVIFFNDTVGYQLNTYLVASNKNQFYIWNLQTKKLLHKHELDHTITFISYQQTKLGNVIIIGKQNGEIELFNPQSRQIIQKFKKIDSPVSNVITHNSQSTIIVDYHNHQSHTFIAKKDKYETGSSINAGRHILGFSDSFAPKVITYHQPGTAYFQELKSSKPFYEISTPLPSRGLQYSTTHKIPCCAFSYTTKYQSGVMVGFEDHIDIFDLAVGEANGHQYMLPKHVVKTDGPVDAMQTYAYEHQLTLAKTKNTIYVINVLTGECIYQLPLDEFNQGCYFDVSYDGMHYHIYSYFHNVKKEFSLKKTTLYQFKNSSELSYLLSNASENKSVKQITLTSTDLDVEILQQLLELQIKKPELQFKLSEFYDRQMKLIGSKTKAVETLQQQLSEARSEMQTRDEKLSRLEKNLEEQAKVISQLLAEQAQQKSQMQDILQDLERANHFMPQDSIHSQLNYFSNSTDTKIQLSERFITHLLKKDTDISGLNLIRWAEQPEIKVAKEKLIEKYAIFTVADLYKMINEVTAQSKKSMVSTLIKSIEQLLNDYQSNLLPTTAREYLKSQIEEQVVKEICNEKNEPIYLQFRLESDIIKNKMVEEYFSKESSENFMELDIIVKNVIQKLKENPALKHYHSYITEPSELVKKIRSHHGENEVYNQLEILIRKSIDINEIKLTESIRQQATATMLATPSVEVTNLIDKLIQQRWQQLKAKITPFSMPKLEDLHDRVITLEADIAKRKRVTKKHSSAVLPNAGLSLFTNSLLQAAITKAAETKPETLKPL